MKAFKWIIFIVLGLVLISFGMASLYLNTFVEEVIRDKLIEDAIPIRGERYRISAEDVEVSIIDGDISLKGFKIEPNPSLIDNSNEPGYAFLWAEEIHVKGLKKRELYFNRNISIKSLELRNPSIKAFLKNAQGEEDNNEVSETTESQVHIPELFIESLILSKANAALFSINGDDTTSLISMASLDVNYKDFFLDSIITGETFPFRYGQAFYSGEGLKVKMSDYQDLYIDKSLWNSEDKILSLITTQIQPEMNAKAYTKTLTYQDDWFAVDANEIRVHPFDPRKIVDKEEMIIDSLVLIRPKAFFYRDLSLPRKNTTKLMPKSAMDNIPFKTVIHNVYVHNGEMKYHEMHEGKKEPLEVVFGSLNSNLSSISSDPNLKMKWKLNLMFQNTIRCDAEIEFFKKNGREWFRAKGSAKEFEFSQLNSLVGAISPLEFEDGKVISLEYDILADDDTSKGWIDLEYTDLKLLLYGKEHDGQTKKNKFLTFGANTVFKKHNLKEADNFTRGAIFVERDKNKSFFNYLWRSIGSGLKSTFHLDRMEKKKNKKKK